MNPFEILQAATQHAMRQVVLNRCRVRLNAMLQGSVASGELASVEPVEVEGDGLTVRATLPGRIERAGFSVTLEM